MRFSAGVACGGLLYSLWGWDEAQHVEVADVHIYNPDIDIWVDGPALPLATRGLAAAEYSGCIYGCSGTVVAPPPSNSLLMLDPRTRSWASLPTQPAPVGYAHAAVVAGRVYMPGGATR